MKCVICKKKIKPYNANKFHPFCSEGCKMVDLYNWLSEEYYISEPAPNADNDSEESEKFWKE